MQKQQELAKGIENFRELSVNSCRVAKFGQGAYSRGCLSKSLLGELLQLYIWPRRVSPCSSIPKTMLKSFQLSFFCCYYIFPFQKGF